MSKTNGSADPKRWTPMPLRDDLPLPWQDPRLGHPEVQRDVAFDADRWRKARRFTRHTLDKRRHQARPVTSTAALRLDDAMVAYKATQDTLTRLRARLTGLLASDHQIKPGAVLRDNR